MKGYGYDFLPYDSQVFHRRMLQGYLSTVKIWDYLFYRYVSDGDGSAAATKECYVYDGEHIALVFDGGGNRVSRYLHRPQIECWQRSPQQEMCAGH